MRTTKLERLNPCRVGLPWAKKQRSNQQAWNDCERGDWMIWLLYKTSGNIETTSYKRLIYVTCQCVRLSLKYAPKNNISALVSIETTERYLKGLATLEEVKKAAEETIINSMMTAAYAAAYAITNKENGPRSIHIVGNDAFAANHTTYLSLKAANNARKRILKRCADIVRRYYPNVPKIK